MPTINAVPGSTEANSYVTVAEAVAYFGERLQVAQWTAASTDDRIRSLIMATRRIDDLAFVGFKVTDVQALKWPRLWALDEDGYEYDTASVPDVVKRATYETALKFLTDNAGGTDALGASGLEAFNRAKVGPLEVEINHSHVASALPDTVVRMLRHVLTATGRMARLVRS